MIAYHLKIKEGKPFICGEEKYDMDALYLPGKDIMFGFHKLNNNEGIIFKYKQQQVLDRVNEVIENRRQGVVVGIKDIHNDVDEFFMFSTSEMKVKTTREFDGSTDCLVKILNGEYRKKGIITRVVELVS